MIHSDEDNVMAGADQVWKDHCPGCAGQPHVTIQGCGHFLQDGGADQLVAAVVKFIKHSSRSSRARL
jgi:haloalkane dehalogenase